MGSRVETLLRGLPRGAKLIEVGASHNPIAPKSLGWNTYTLDHLDREGLRAKYRDHAAVDTSRIETVDFVWADGPLSSAVPADVHGTFDAFIASHVVEHTPDLTAFLDSAETLLKPDGVVILAIPDKRYCFDYFQTLTTTGQVLAAHSEKRVRHDPWLGFDYLAYAARDGGEGGWSQHPSRGLSFVHSLEEAETLRAALASSSDYIDMHAWRFTPSSFELVMLELAYLGKTDWRVDRTTAAEGCEFFAWLRRGGKSSAAALSQGAFATRRLSLLKQTMLELRAQVDWLLAGEPSLIPSPLALLPAPLETASQGADAAAET